MIATLLILGGAVFGVLGVLHTIYTLLDLRNPRRLAPVGCEFRPYGRAWVYCPAERKVWFPSRKEADVMAPSDRKLFGSRASHECLIR